MYRIKIYTCPLLIFSYCITVCLFVNRVKIFFLAYHNISDVENLHSQR